MSTEGMIREIGVGLISVGWMGRLHTRSYKAVAEHYPELGLKARLVIAADTVEASAREAAELLGYESWTLDYHDVLTHPDVDVVSICAPNFLHKEMAVAAAKAGRPFWIEKPMGRGVEESREIARAAAGIVTGVGFNYRHAPAVQHARGLIRSGTLGRITNVRCWLLADYSSKPVGGAASHFSKGVGGELKPVENEDYAGVLARFASRAGTFESSRVAVGPRRNTSWRSMARPARFAGTSSDSTNWRSVLAWVDPTTATPP